MNTGVRNTVILCLAFVAMVLGALFYNASREPLLSDEALREEGVVLLPRPRAVAPFVLENQEGDPFSLDMLRGKWNLIYFGYTYCPDICPVTLASLAKTEEGLRKAGEQALLDKLRVILVTVDPERDDPATLKQYLKAFSNRFIGLTGTKKEIAALATELNVAFGKVPRDGDSYLVDHTGNIVLINPQGHYVGFIRPPHDPEEMQLILKTLANRSS